MSTHDPNDLDGNVDAGIATRSPNEPGHQKNFRPVDTRKDAEDFRRGRGGFSLSLFEGKVLKPTTQIRTKNETLMASLGLGFYSRYVDRHGRRGSTPVYFNPVAFGDQALFALNELRKGMTVRVLCRVKYTPRFRHQPIVWDIKILDNGKSKGHRQNANWVDSPESSGMMESDLFGDLIADSGKSLSERFRRARPRIGGHVTIKPQASSRRSRPKAFGGTARPGGRGDRVVKL